MNETENGMKREVKDDKLNFLDYFTPHVLKRYAAHMKKNEHHGRGNWKKGGYPVHEYLESNMRHLVAAWENIGDHGYEGDEDHLAAQMFNIVALMNEQHLKSNQEWTAASNPLA